MTNISHELVAHAVQRYERELPCVFGSGETIVVDTSGWQNFVPNRSGDDSYLNLAERWQVFAHVQELLLERINDNISFPVVMRAEFAWCSKMLQRFVDKPYEAMRYRLGGRGGEASPAETKLYDPSEDVADAAREALRKYLDSRQHASDLFRVLPSQAHIDSSVRHYVEPIQKAIQHLVARQPPKVHAASRPVRYDGRFRKSIEAIGGRKDSFELIDMKPFHRGGPRIAHRDNDSAIFAKAVAISYTKPVTLRTGDSDFEKIHNAIYRGDGEQVLREHGLPMPAYGLTLVLDYPGMIKTLKRP